jgi:hypothetical protein
MAYQDGRILRDRFSNALYLGSGAGRVGLTRGRAFGFAFFLFVAFFGFGNSRGSVCATRRRASSKLMSKCKGFSRFLVIRSVGDR